MKSYPGTNRLKVGMKACADANRLRVGMKAYPGTNRLKVGMKACADTNCLKVRMKIDADANRLILIVLPKGVCAIDVFHRSVPIANGSSPLRRRRRMRDGMHRLHRSARKPLRVE
jgi:hypothetical protein